MSLTCWRWCQCQHKTWSVDSSWSKMLCQLRTFINETLLENKLNKSRGLSVWAARISWCIPQIYLELSTPLELDNQTGGVAAGTYNCTYMYVWYNTHVREHEQESFHSKESCLAGCPLTRRPWSSTTTNKLVGYEACIQLQLQAVGSTQKYGTSEYRLRQLKRVWKPERLQVHTSCVVFMINKTDLPPKVVYRMASIPLTNVYDVWCDVFWQIGSRGTFKSWIVNRESWIVNRESWIVNAHSTFCDSQKWFMQLANLS